MQALDRLGDRAGALEAYEAFAKRLTAELEADPAPETRALAGAVRERVATLSSNATELPPLETAAELPEAAGVPRLRRRWLGVAAALLGLAVVIAAVSLRSREPAPLNAKRVLVVPFANRTDDSTLDPLEPVLGRPQEPRPALTILRERIMAVLAEALDSRLGALASAAGQPPRYDAYLAFSAGVEIFYGGRRARDALPYFQRAAALDSTYALPLIWAAWAHGGTALDQCDSTAVIAGRLAGMRLTGLEQMQIDRVMARCRGDLPAAYALGRALTEALPRSELMWEQLARDALDFDRPREAVTILERLHPDSGALDGRAGYYNWLTNAYHLLGQHDRELEAAQRARRRFPRNLATLRMELLALAALGRAREVSQRQKL